LRGPIRLPLEQLQPYLYDVTPAPAPIVWSKLFGNSSPVEIEVGFGKGLFLLTASQMHPETNYFGIEIERKYQLFTANRLAKRGLHNVRLACADARALMAERAPAGSVQAVHVYFPDPWWKKRHHKRRLFNAAFARACVEVLQIGGRLEIMSDVEAYHATIVGLLAEQPGLQPGPGSHLETDYRTNFERKYRLAGKPIFGASYVRTSALAAPG
jgi:tRNA (guanine-N7-)-methyltransferase